MVSDHLAVVVYCVVLWIAFFGAVAFDARSPSTRGAKALLAVTFAVLMVDSLRMGE